MKILKRVITSLASRGHITLQVPQYSIIIENERAIAYPASALKEEKIMDAPDEWFISLRSDCPTAGKEQGCTFLTRAGWEANKEDIKKAFKSSKGPRGTWDDFEKYAEHHFARVKKNIIRRTKLLNSKVKQLKEALKTV